MKKLSKCLLVALAALALLVATSINRGSAKWSWAWIKFKPFRCDIGPTIYGLDPGGKLLVDGRFYLLGPILITQRVTNAPLAVKPGNR